MIDVILIPHILLALVVSIGFLARYVLAFKQKSYPKEGRTPLFFGSALLVISGTVLAAVDHLTIKGICLDSLGLIVALIVLELGLQFISSKLAEERIRTDKK